MRKVDKTPACYCAFSLLVTLIWLYVEILDLLRMLSGRD